MVSDADSPSPVGGTLQDMPTLVRDPPPAEFEVLLQRRQQLGQDLYDEVWDGVLHMNPTPAGRHGQIEYQLAVILAPLARAAGLTITGTFNLGIVGDYRVPDGGMHRDWRDQVWYGTAALVIEIVSPDDETWSKLEFYARRGVEELLVVDPAERTVSWMGLERGEYKHLKRSRLIELGAAELAERIDWPE